MLHQEILENYYILILFDSLFNITISFPSDFFFNAWWRKLLLNLRVPFSIFLFISVLCLQRHLTSHEDRRRGRIIRRYRIAQDTRRSSEYPVASTRYPWLDFQEHIVEAVYIYICTYIFPYSFPLCNRDGLCYSPFRFIVNSIYLAVAYHSLVKYHVHSTSKVLTRLRLDIESIRRKTAFEVLQKRNRQAIWMQTSEWRIILLYLYKENKFKTFCKFFDYKFSNKLQTKSLVLSCKMSFCEKARVINRSLEAVIT